MRFTPEQKSFVRIAAREAAKVSSRWVVFEFGSFLNIRNDNQASIGAYARNLLQQHGHMTRGHKEKILYEVHPIPEGWLVSSVQIGLYTIVLEKEIQGKAKDLKNIGLFGLSKRHSDSIDPRIIFLEAGL